MIRVRVVALVGVLASMCSGTAFAQTPQVAAPQNLQAVREEIERLRRDFAAMQRAYDERLSQLEKRLGDMGAVAPAQQAPVPQTPAQPAPGVLPPGSGKVFNPDISVNGNFIGAAGRNPFATLSPMQLSEVEAAFQAIVDPYARADFFLAAGTEGMEVEEGYITFTSLPANMLVKVGKLRAQFGKMNTLHTHSLPTVDRPLVTTNLLGGDEGFADAGISVSHLVNHPSLYLELTGEVFAGTSDVFQSVERSQLTYLGRVRSYRDFNASSNLDFGASFAYGTATVDVPPGLLTAVDPEAPTLQATGQGKRMAGIDVTFRYRPPSRAIYRRLNVRTELIWSRQDLPDAEPERAFGVYTSAEYQFARRWYVGGRLDRSGRTLDGDAIDTGASVFMTFWPTEFSQIRGQFRRINFAEGDHGNEFLFQFNFSIGAHAAHIF